MPKARHRRATWVPIRPRPMTRSRFPESCMPMNRLRFHSPDATEFHAWGTFRTRESIMARVCSVAARVFPVGALITTIPRRLAAARSMLSTPTPALATARSFFAAPSTSPSRGVPLRVSMPSASATASSSSSLERPSRTSTWSSFSFRSRLIPASDTVSVTSTFISVIPLPLSSSSRQLPKNRAEGPGRTSSRLRRCFRR